MIGVVAVLVTVAASVNAFTATNQVAIANATLTPIAHAVQDQQNLNTSLQLGAQANAVFQDPNGNPLLPILYSIRGLKTAYSPQADAALVHALDVNPIKRVLMHDASVRSVAFSPDGKYILTGVGQNPTTGAGGNTVILWDAATGDSIRTFTGHTASVNSVVFSPDGK